ncbi:MAG: AAA family ATPase [Bacillota bacterium]
MIDHVHIKNFMAFKDETVVLGNHTLFIGRHSSGKTTLLRALDLFFNHKVDFEDVRNKKHDVVIECSIDEETYTKVFTPPHYTLNAHKSHGAFEDILDMHYLYLPVKPYPMSHFVNQCFALNYTPTQEELETPNLENFERGTFKGTVNYHSNPYYQIAYPDTMKDKEKKHLRVKWLKTLSRGRLVLAADELEKSIDFDDLDDVLDLSEQALFVSRQKKFINAFPYRVHPLYKSDIEREMTTITDPMHKSSIFLLVEGKYDVPWFESGLRILGKETHYRVIPSGGSGNLKYVNEQLTKAGYKTLVISDGDVNVPGYSLNRDIIELYVDENFLRKTFNVTFKKQPKNKHQFFASINEKDDIIKKVLSRYATYHLYLDHPFVKELRSILEDFEARKGLNID